MHTSRVHYETRSRKDAADEQRVQGAPRSHGFFSLSRLFLFDFRERGREKKTPL